MANSTHAAALIVVMSIVTIILRAFPFLVLRGKKTPTIISYLGDVLPYAVMAMLVVYCFKNTSFISAPFGIPEIIAGLLTAVTFVWKRNTLLSIITGTLCYMVFVQVIFV